MKIALTYILLFAICFEATQAATDGKLRVSRLTMAELAKHLRAGDKDIHQFVATTVSSASTLQSDAATVISLLNDDDDQVITTILTCLSHNSWNSPVLRAAVIDVFRDAKNYSAQQRALALVAILRGPAPGKEPLVLEALNDGQEAVILEGLNRLGILASKVSDLEIYNRASLYLSHPKEDIRAKALDAIIKRASAARTMIPQFLPYFRADVSSDDRATLLTGLAVTPRSEAERRRLHQSFSDALATLTRGTPEYAACDALIQHFQDVAPIDPSVVGRCAKTATDEAATPASSTQTRRVGFRFGRKLLNNQDP